MKKMVLLIGLLSLLTGCATKPPVTTNPFAKYYPWEHYATAVDKTFYLVNMNTKREVGPNVYSVWTKDSSISLDTIHEEIFDCNSRESMRVKSVVFQNGKVVTEFTYKGATFKRQVPTTVGYALIEKVCR